MKYNSDFSSMRLAVAIFCVLGATGAVIAQVPTRGPMNFGAFDQNTDGVVTEQEFNTARAERMAARAAQGAPMRGAANAPSFTDFDLNGDGVVSPAEFAAAKTAHRQSHGRAQPNR